MTYEEKIAVADAYIESKCGLDWDSLSDINSLHDCDSQEDIIAACDARLEEDGYPMEYDNELDPDGDGVEDELEEDGDIEEDDLYGHEELEGDDDEDNTNNTDY